MCWLTCILPSVCYWYQKPDQTERFWWYWTLASPSLRSLWSSQYLVFIMNAYCLLSNKIGEYIFLKKSPSPWKSSDLKDLFMTSCRARRCPWRNFFLKKHNWIILAHNTPTPPTKNFQPNLSSSLAGYTQHKYIYEYRRLLTQAF